MKTKGVLFLICALTYVTAVAEYNCWASVNGIGDYMIVAVGELDKPFTMAKPISIDLAPTNAPDENASYSVRCRVCYIDNLLPCPKSDDDLKLVRLTGKVLNSLLKEFIAGQYVAAEYKELIEAYFNGDFVRDLNKRFKDYVADQISGMGPSVRLDISIITVETEAEGAFREDLIRAIASQESE